MIPGGLILAGGRGERLGGQDKGLLLHDGEPYVAHLARCLGPVTSAVAISANDHDADYRHWANTVLADRHFRARAPCWPLRGIILGPDPITPRFTRRHLRHPCTAPHGPSKCSKPPDSTPKPLPVRNPRPTPLPPRLLPGLCTTNLARRPHRRGKPRLAPSRTHTSPSGWTAKPWHQDSST